MVSSEKESFLRDAVPTEGAVENWLVVEREMASTLHSIHKRAIFTTRLERSWVKDNVGMVVNTARRSGGPLRSIDVFNRVRKATRWA